METDVSPDVVVMARTEVLHRVIYEIGRKIGVGEHIFELLRKGIVENQWLETVTFGYSDGAQGIFDIRFDINWEKHSVSANTSDGKSFELGNKRSIAEQVLSISFAIEGLIDDARLAYPKAVVFVHFNVRKDIARKSEQRAVVDRSLKLTAAESLDWDGVDIVTVEYTPESLDELGIVIRARPKQ